jgi:hypothetical protein
LQLAISWFGCPTLPSDTIDHGRDRAVRLDLGPFMVGRGLHAADLQRRLRSDATVPWPFGSHRLQPGAYGEAWQQAWK